MSEIKKAEFGYAEKSALFDEVQKALKALNLRAKQYGVDEVYNWCKFVLGAKPGSFTEGQQIAAAWNLRWAIEMRCKKPECVDTPWKEEKA